MCCVVDVCCDMVCALIYVIILYGCVLCCVGLCCMYVHGLAWTCIDIGCIVDYYMILCCMLCLSGVCLDNYMLWGSLL